MSNPVLIQIADAVVTAINADDWSQEFDAARSYMARTDLEDMDVLHVDVVPGTISSVLASRATTQDEYRVDVAVRQRFSGEANADIDPLAELTQEIADRFRFSSVSDLRAVWIRSDIDPLFVPQHLQSWRQFTGIVRFTYRLQR